MSKLAVTIEGRTFEVELDIFPSFGTRFTVQVNGEEILVDVPDIRLPLAEMEWLVVGDRSYEIAFDLDLHWLRGYRGLHEVEVHDMESGIQRPRSGDGRVKAPIPGLITRILVEPGQEIESGQPIIILEAMKMENEIRASRSGTIKVVNVQVGQTVTNNDVLVEIS